MPHSAVLLLLAVCSPLWAQDRGQAGEAEMQRMRSLFAARDYRDPQGERMVYRLLRPKAYDAKRKYPALLFFHGAGQGGGNNETQLLFCLDRLASEENRDAFPCFVVAPQLHVQAAGEPWGFAGAAHWDRPYRTGAEPSKGERLAMGILDSVQAEFSIDPKRIYLSGLSMGAFAVWDLAYRYPGRFAAAVPICGGGEPGKSAGLAQVAVWAFHGENDPVIPVQRSREMIAAMQALGQHPRYTEYPGEVHDIWSMAYAEKDLIPWLFAQSR